VTANSADRSWLIGSTTIGPSLGTVALVVPGTTAGAGGTGVGVVPTGAGATPTPKKGSP
jgi:hypothetical protein